MDALRSLSEMIRAADGAAKLRLAAQAPSP